MPEKDITAWRKAILEDPEVSKFASLMFHSKEDALFVDLNDYVMHEGRELANKIYIYAVSKGYGVSQEEILEGFKTVAPEIQDMVKTAWEKALGSYHRAEIARGEAQA